MGMMLRRHKRPKVDPSAVVPDLKDLPQDEPKVEPEKAPEQEPAQAVDKDANAVGSKKRR